MAVGALSRFLGGGEGELDWGGRSLPVGAGWGAKGRVMRADGPALSFAEFSVKCRIALQRVLSNIVSCGCNRNFGDTSDTRYQGAGD